MSDLLKKRQDNDTITICVGGKITARHVAAWIATLPDEFQDAEFDSIFAGSAVTLKRIVALKSKDGTVTSVCANSCGTHFPFTDSYKWFHTLTT